MERFWLTQIRGHLHSVCIPSAQITNPRRLFLITCLMRQHGKCSSGHFPVFPLPARRWRGRHGSHVSSSGILSGTCRRYCLCRVKLCSALYMYNYCSSGFELEQRWNVCFALSVCCVWLHAVVSQRNIWCLSFFFSLFEKDVCWSWYIYF